MKKVAQRMKNLKKRLDNERKVKNLKVIEWMKSWENDLAHSTILQPSKNGKALQYLWVFLPPLPPPQVPHIFIQLCATFGIYVEKRRSVLIHVLIFILGS